LAVFDGPKSFVALIFFFKALRPLEILFNGTNKVLKPYSLKDERLERQRTSPAVRQKLDHFVEETKGSMTFWTGTFQMKCNEEAK